MISNEKVKVKRNGKATLIEQEIKFARVLAGNDKKLRDRALKNLKKWLAGRSYRKTPFSEDDFLRLWKGLFYCMWMSDKLLVQEECAELMSDLVKCFIDGNESILFFKSFLQTMKNEWFGIDQLRLNKFLMLVRRVLRKTLESMDTHEWKSEIIINFGKAVSDEIFSKMPHCPLGLKMHFLEIYLEELAKVSHGKLECDTLIEFIEPFADQMARLNDEREISHVAKHIFRHLILQSDAGIEYEEKFALWKSSGCKGSLADIKKIELESDDHNSEESGDEEEEDLLDPRAGQVDVHLPQIQFDANKVADMLEKYRYSKNSNVKSRKTVGQLITEFRMLASGENPLEVEHIKNLKTSDNEYVDVNEAVVDLLQFENELDEKKLTKIQKRKLKRGEDIFESEPVLKKSKAGETKNQTNVNNKEIKKEKETTKKKIKENKQKLSILSKKKNELVSKKKTKQNKIVSEAIGIAPCSGIWLITECSKNDEAVSKKSDDKQEMKKGPIKEFKNKNSSIKNDLKNIKNQIVRTVKNKTDGIKRKKEKKNMTHTETTVTPIKNPKLSSIAQTPNSEKKVKIVLKRNKAQDTKEYVRQLKNSPAIPYDATKKPLKPLLKVPVVSSPINPFYNLNDSFCI